MPRTASDVSAGLGVNDGHVRLATGVTRGHGAPPGTNPPTGPDQPPGDAAVTARGPRRASAAACGMSCLLCSRPCSCLHSSLHPRGWVWVVRRDCRRQPARCPARGPHLHPTPASCVDLQVHGPRSMQMCRSRCQCVSGPPSLVPVACRSLPRPGGAWASMQLPVALPPSIRAVDAALIAILSVLGSAAAAVGNSALLVAGQEIARPCLAVAGWGRWQT